MPAVDTTANADRYAVFGNPIAHSKSPQIHALFAAQTGQRIRYDAICAPLDGFASSVRDFIAAGGRGANVTVPFKLDAHALADTLSARAAAAGAVNTLSFADGVITGDNTDGIGLVTDLLQRCMQPLAGARILVLGAGGAVRGALLPLLEAKPQTLVIANRTVAKAEELADLFVASAGPTALAAVGFDALAQQSPFDVIINGTAASLHGDVPPLPDSLWQGSATLAYDMMYGAAPTPFLQVAAGHDARGADGLGMLVEQAAEAFAVWRGVRPQTQPVYDALRALLRGA